MFQAIKNMFGGGKVKKATDKIKKVIKNPLDKKKVEQTDSSVINNIVTTETAPKDEKILDAAPDIDTSLLQDITPQKSFLLIGLKSLFIVFIVSSVVSLVFFTSQLTNTFDFASSVIDIPNISKELGSTNAELISLQTDRNFYRYLQIKAALDAFSYDEVGWT